MKTKKTTIAMIKEFADAFGPSGMEDRAVLVGRKYAKGLGQLEEDHIRNLFLYRKENHTVKDGASNWKRIQKSLPGQTKVGADPRPVLMLDAHTDEISFMIQAIHENGTMDFLPIGSQVASSMPAIKVNIQNAKGELIPAVISTKPPHFSTAADAAKPLNAADFVMDVGAVSREEVEEVFDIHPGCFATFAVEMTYDEKANTALGKAFDCRIGCAVIMDALNRLKGKELPTEVVATLTTQEEVGERGCIAAVQELRPDLAIILEGAPADDTFTEPYKIQNGIKRGPMLRHIDVKMITHPRFIRYALDVAKELKIPTQEAVRSGGATNGAVIHNITGSVPCIVIAVPVRYTHTAHCFISLEDYEKTVELIVALLERLDGKILAGF